MPENLLAAPRLHGVMFDSQEYTNMNVGITDTIMIIGHGDGYDLNNPVPVVDIRKTIQQLGADDACPVLRAVIEAYYAGARDIWVVLAAPMEEYVPVIGDRSTFYETYADRLAVTYDLLVDYDIPQIVVTLDAPMFGAGDVDFLTPLADFCANGFDVTGAVRMGLIGTEIDNFTPEVIDEMVADERLTDVGASGRFILPVLGSGVFNLREIPTVYTSSPLASLAGRLSTQYWDRGLTYERVPNVVTIGFKDFTKGDVERLCAAKLNPLIRTTRSKRGRSGEIVLASDNTLGQDGSDLWSINQVRLIMHCIDRIRDLGNGYVGTTDYSGFKRNVESFFGGLMVDSVIRGFDLHIQQLGPSQENGFASSVDVDVSVQPFFGIRDIGFTTRIGPGA